MNTLKKFGMITVVAATIVIVNACKKETSTKSSGTNQTSFNAPSQGEDCQLTTYSKGGYGNSGTPNQIMAANWDCIGSVSIGCDVNVRTFNSVQDVQDYLPNGDGGLYGTNGTVQLGSQILALTISCAIDNCNADFGSSDCNLEDTKLAAQEDFATGGAHAALAPLVGKTVSEILEIANNVLGGCSNAYTKADLIYLIELLNMNYHPANGEEVDNGYLINSCCASCDLAFRTQTQGGWGSTPKGGNPGAYLKNNWSMIDGSNSANTLTIGYGSYTKTFTKSSEVDGFLPRGGSCNNTDPFSSVFAGQALTLAINVALDNNISSFGTSNGKLADLVVANGTFQGMTVAEILNEANMAFAGAGNYTPCHLVDVLTMINENFDNGTVNQGFLTCK
ncbi:MAG: hypothetical protein RL642_614 [Bacteroidota bacterium]|jgi:hypothetical protein